MKHAPAERWRGVLRRHGPAAALVIASMTIAVSVVWGRRIQAREPRVNLGAAPLVGAWKWRPSWKLLPAIVLAAVAVWWFPRIAARVRFAFVVLLGSLFSVVFTIALAASDGANAVVAPVVQPAEYWANLATLPKAGFMLRHFASVSFLYGRSVHLKGHPPGFVLLLKGMAAIGLKRPAFAGALSFLGVAMVAAAVLVTVRTVAGVEVARRTAPFLIVAPYAIWMGTSADAFYAGVVASGVALTAIGVRRPHALGRAMWGLAAGVVLGWALFLSYGVVPALLLPLALAVGAGWNRALKPTLAGLRAIPTRTGPLLGGAVVGAGAVTVAFRWAGFWWLDGLRVTKQYYWWGTAHWRPWTYFLLANLAVLMIALGPAVVGGMARLRDSGMRLIVVATLAGVALADLSQYSKGEVERIWLLFMPWLVPAAATCRRPRPWLAAQAAVTIGLQAWLVSKW